MFKKILFFLFLPLMLTACHEEPELDLFHLTLGTAADAEVAMGIHSADVTINGYARWIEIGIVGKFDSYTLSDNLPDWMTISNAELMNVPNHFRINISALDGDDSRVGKVEFTVFKGSKSQAGSITIVQNPCTLADLKKTEQRAIKAYLSKFDVVNVLPPLADIRVGSVAPFYKLDAQGTVYMQVVRMGTQPAATDGQTIYFRYMRYNLLSYLNDGVLPAGEGNLNSATQDVTSFELGSAAPSTTQWGIALQLPLQIGLPADSEVNLIVASEAGPPAEQTSVTPFLYNIRYLHK